MSMIVSGQHFATMTSRFLDQSHESLSRGLQRLSSGIRFSSSADDAGNLAVSVKLNSKLRRSSAIHNNIQNARSFLSMQEDAYKKLGTIIDRMSVLRTRFDGPLENQSDIVNLNFEFKELQQEINQMSRAKLNGVSLFSTEDQSKFPFYLETGEGGARVQVTRTGFFENLTLNAQGAGSTPNFSVMGNVGSMNPQNFSVNPKGTVVTNPNFDAIQGTMTPQAFNVGMSHSPNGTINSAATDGLYDLQPDVKISGGGTTVSMPASAVTLNANGTLSIDMSTLPAGITAAGAYTVKADDGAIYLKPTSTDSVAAAAGNQGSDYTTLPPQVTIKSPSGATVTADPSAGPITVDGLSFAFAMKTAVGDTDKFGITVTGTPGTAGNFTISPDDGPLGADNKTLTGGTGYHDPAAVPTVSINNTAGTQVATVTPTVNLDGTLSIDMSTLPAGLVTAGAGDYTVQAPDVIYLDPDLATRTDIKDIGSGVVANGIPTSVKITGPSGTEVTGNPVTGIVVDGLTFKLQNQTAPDDVDKMSLSATGTPTAEGDFKLELSAGPLESGSGANVRMGANYDDDTALMAKPAVQIKDPSAGAVGTVPASAVAVQTDGTVQVTFPSDLSTWGITSTGTGYTLTADDAFKLASTTFSAGSGYLASNPLPLVTLQGPSGTSTTGNPDPTTGGGVVGAVDGVSIQSVQMSATTPGELDVTLSGVPTQAGNFTISFASGAPQGTASGSVTSIEGTTTGATGTVGVNVVVDPTDVTATERWHTGTTATNWIATSPVRDSADTLYFVSGTNAGNSRVHAFNEADPSKNWTVLLGSRTRTDITLSPDGSSLYVTRNDGTLRAYDTIDGSEKWATDYDTGAGSIRSKPAVSQDGSTVYFGGRDDNLHAVDAALGTGKWIYDTGDEIFSSPVVDSSGPNPIIYVGSDSNRLHAIQDNGVSGDRVWRSAFLWGDVKSSPALSADGSRVFVGDDAGVFYAFNTSSTSNNNGSLFGGFFGERPGGFGGGPIQSTMAVGPNGNVYFGDSNGTFYAYQQDGTKLGEFALGGNFQYRSAVVNSSNEVFFTHGNGNAYSLDGTNPGLWDSGNLTKTAGVNWIGAMGGQGIQSPVLSADGQTAFVGSRDNQVHAFTVPSTEFGLATSTVTIGQNYHSSDTLALSDVTLTQGGVALTSGVTVNSASNNGDGTFDIGLTGKPSAGGSITVTAINGKPHLADLNAFGSGYPVMTAAELTALKTGTTITGTNPGDEGSLLVNTLTRTATGELNLTFSGTANVAGNFTITVPNGPGAGSASPQTVGTITGTTATPATFDVVQTGVSSTTFTNLALKGTMPTALNLKVAPEGTASDITLAALQGTMAGQNLTVGLAATSTPVTGGVKYDAKPVVNFYTNATATGPAAGAVAPGDVTLLGDGTLSIDLSTLPTGVNAAGSYSLKAVDGSPYLDPAGTNVTNVGSGYSAVPTSATITGPSGTVVVGDPSTGPIVADGVSFAFALQTTPGNTDKLSVTASGVPSQTGTFQLSIADGPLAANTSSITAGSGYAPADNPVTTISDGGGTSLGTVTVSNNGNGTLTIDLSALPAGVTTAGAGNYKVQSANGSNASTPPPVTVGSGYSLADNPVVTLSGPATGGVSVASSTVNPNGTVGITFSGKPATTGPISVSVSGGSGGGQTAGLTNENLNLWDFSVMDFTRYIQVLANVRSVNGAESSSFNFSDTLLTNNWENLEMAASRLTDTDIALELVSVAKNRIKTSTAADLLAKHNNLGTMVDLTVMNLA